MPLNLDGRLSEYSTSDSPQYASMQEYPDNMTVGDTLFPMLYLYYYGDPANERRVGNPEKFRMGLERIFGRGGGSSGQLAARFTQNIRKFYQMFTSAVQENTQFNWMLHNSVVALMRSYESRIPLDPRRCYYGTTRSQCSHTPVLNTGDANNLGNCMEALRLLFENDIIAYDYRLETRPISLYDGSFADQLEQITSMANTARVLGLPSKGIFTINNRPKTNYMFRTFSGIDMKAIASLSSVVTDLEGLSQLSWSIHSGRMATRPLGKANPGGSRSAGSRTIAGTMIFVIADTHPLLELVPADYPATKQGQYDKAIWRPNLMPDQLPPFDLMLVMQNEYGYAAILSLYGVQVADEGGVVGVDNLLTEVTIQYTALAMDPITRVQVDSTGTIDPYGLMQAGYSDLWKHRELIVAGVAYSDLEAAYEAQYDGVFMGMQERDRQHRVSRTSQGLGM